MTPITTTNVFQKHPPVPNWKLVAQLFGARFQIAVADALHECPFDDVTLVLRADGSELPFIVSGIEALRDGAYQLYGSGRQRECTASADTWLQVRDPHCRPIRPNPHTRLDQGYGLFEGGRVERTAAGVRQQGLLALIHPDQSVAVHWSDGSFDLHLDPRSIQPITVFPAQPLFPPQSGSALSEADFQVLLAVQGALGALQQMGRPPKSLTPDLIAQEQQYDLALHHLQTASKLILERRT